MVIWYPRNIHEGAPETHRARTFRESQRGNLLQYLIDPGPSVGRTRRCHRLVLHCQVDFRLSSLTPPLCQCRGCLRFHAFLLSCDRFLSLPIACLSPHFRVPVCSYSYNLVQAMRSDRDLSLKGTCPGHWTRGTFTPGKRQGMRLTDTGDIVHHFEFAPANLRD